MAGKYRSGQRFPLKDGRTLEVLDTARSIHGNTSRINYRFLDADGNELDRSQRPVRTSFLTEALKRLA